MTALELLLSVLFYGVVIFLIMKAPIDAEIKVIARWVLVALFTLHVLAKTGLLAALNFRL